MPRDLAGAGKIGDLVVDGFQSRIGLFVVLVVGVCIRVVEVEKVGIRGHRRNIAGDGWKRTGQPLREVLGAVHGTVHTRRGQGDGALLRCDGVEQLGEAFGDPRAELSVFGDPESAEVAVPQLLVGGHEITEGRAEFLADGSQCVLGFGDFPQLQAQVVVLQARQCSGTMARNTFRVHGGVSRRRRLIVGDALAGSVGRLGREAAVADGRYLCRTGTRTGVERTER